MRAAIQEGLDEAMRRIPDLERKAQLRSRLAELKETERAVLDAMLDGKGNKEISQELEIGLRTVELRRSKIMAKMQATNVAQLIRLVCEASGCSPE
jgi:two-component system response regulator FixJ